MSPSSSILSPGRRWLVGALWIASLTLPAAFKALGEPRFVDLSLLVAPEYPVTWPANWPFFQINRYLRIGPQSAYNSDILTIDENLHSVPAPDTKLSNAGALGLASATGRPLSSW